MLVPVPVIPPGLIVQTPVAGRPVSSTLPVGAEHDAGWLIVPTIGAVGAAGALFITALADDTEIHPASLLTVKLYVPGLRFEIVVVVPVPVIAPGLIVHIPVAGNPLSTTLPIGDAHEEGCVIVPTIGAVGAAGALLITTLADSMDIHPASLVTLNVYVPGLRLSIVADIPVPVIAPGLIVHIPAGRPLRITLPVGAAHEAGCVIVPITGAVGATGAASITTVEDASDIHPVSVVT